MNCQEFDKHIQAFIERDMDYSRLDEFIAHYRSCEDCHEELEINFLMAYVLKDDSQTSFNLSRKLECHIQEELNKILQISVLEDIPVRAGGSGGCTVGNLSADVYSIIGRFGFIYVKEKNSFN